MLNTANAATTVAHVLKADGATHVSAMEVKASKPAKPRSPRKAKANSAADAVIANIAKTAKGTMVTIGGTDAEPERADAADFPAVTLRELSNSGSTLQSLAFNFLAGTVDKSITAESLAELPRALRNEKGAIVKLLGQKASDIRAKWEAEQAKRKRKDRPTLRALAALFTVRKAGTTQTWKEKVNAILSKRISAELKIQALRELVAE